jgi:hypothetical protein
MMDYRSQLITLAQEFGRLTKRSEARVATMVASRGTFFVHLRNGASCTVDTYLEVKRWFAENWPADAAWPAGVDRAGALPLASDPPTGDAPTRDGDGADDGAGGVSAAGPVDPDQPTPDKEAA